MCVEHSVVCKTHGWTDSSVGRALHWYPRGLGLESHSLLVNLGQANRLEVKLLSLESIK